MKHNSKRDLTLKNPLVIWRFLLLFSAYKVKIRRVTHNQAILTDEVESSDNYHEYSISCHIEPIFLWRQSAHRWLLGGWASCNCYIESWHLLHNLTAFGQYPRDRVSMLSVKEFSYRWSWHQQYPVRLTDPLL